MKWTEAIETVAFEIKRQTKLSTVGGAEHLRVAAALAYILGAALEQVAREKEEDKPCM